MLPAILGLGSAGLYATSAGLLFYRLQRRDGDTDHSKRLALALAALAVALHAWLLASDIFHVGGLDLGFFNALSLVGWLVAGMLVVLALRQPVENLGIGLLPLVALGVIVELLYTQRGSEATGSQLELGVQMHALFSITAYGLLALAATQALLLALQNARLHAHHPGGFLRALPSLALMETLLFRMIGAGFILLSLSLLTGFIFVDDLFAQHLVHKTTLSLAGWGVFAALLVGRVLRGWRGRQAVRWTLTGIVLLILAYFGSKLVLELLLGR